MSYMIYNLLNINSILFEGILNRFIRNAGVRCSSHLGGTTTKVHGPRITSQVTESKQQLFRGRNLVDHGVGKVSGILL